MGYCLHMSSEWMPGLKKRSSVEANEKVKGYPQGILGVRKQRNNFRSQPTGVATEELRNRTASDHSS